MTRFADSFWNPEFCNFAGFEVLCKRMKDGKQMTKDYVDFLKLRAQAQEAYGKALVKVAKSAGGKDEIGTLRQAWEVLRSQTESIGLAHIATANAIIEEMNKVMEFMESQRESRRKLEEGVRRNQANIKVLHKKTVDSKKACESRCREADTASQALNNETVKANAMPKEIEKLKQKQVKANSLAEQADSIFRTAVDGLEQARVQWEQETESSCESFQQLEEERIQNVRNSMWATTNLNSALCVNEDEMCEEVRKVLEKCDVDADIQTFIRQRQTGSDRPAGIEYENYFGGQLEKNGNPPFQPKTKIFAHAIATRIQPKANVSLTNLSSPNYNEIIENSENLENDLYDGSFGPTTPQKENNVYRVVYDFEGRNDEELTLKEDDIVTLVHKENADWWEVETKQKARGYFPAAYMEPA